MATDTIVGYTYNAETVCPKCILAAMSPDGIALEDAAGADAESVLSFCAFIMNIDRHDEHSFDSSEFPKIIFEVQVDQREPCNKCGVDLLD